MNEPVTNRRDFAKLRQSGLAPGATLPIGMRFVNGRTRVARGLVALGVRPNHVTVGGFVATLFAAACCLVGASHHAPYEQVIPGIPQSYWPLGAAVFLFFAGACDMLDGAVARVSGAGSRFGGVLDSTLDRCSDITLYLAMCVHFAYRGNLTYATLAVIAMCNGYLISYVKARAEEYIDDCSVGFWLRGERTAGLLLACLCFHLPAWLWLQAVAPFFTVLRRLWHVHVTLGEGKADSGSPPPFKLPGVVRSILTGQCPRGSLAYDMMVGASILFFVVAPWVHPFFYGSSDPVRSLLAPLLGH